MREITVGERFAGQLHRASGRFAIVVARFNGLITERLLAGAWEAFGLHGVEAEQVDIAYVPGSFEIPLVARRLAQTGRYAAIICLGAVVRGETAHFEHVAGQAAAGVARTGYECGLPVIFGVLTTNTVEQALDRAGVKSGNAGYQAVVDAIEMADLLRQIDTSAGSGP
jgi:6,7-dimethyl-8-ribityllumazine synthase